MNPTAINGQEKVLIITLDKKELRSSAKHSMEDLPPWKNLRPALKQIYKSSVGTGGVGQA